MAQNGTQPGLRSTLLDRSLLTDPRRCPACGEALASPRCESCGVDLSGDPGGRLWQLSTQAARLLDERDAVIGDLRDAAAAMRAASTASGTSVARPPVAGVMPSQGWAVPSAGMPPRPPLPPAQPAAAVPARRSGAGVHGLLVGLGALLLAVAAVGFLIFSWRVLSLGGRATIIGGCTLAVLALATWLRPRLSETAEAVGALGVVLVLADAWAIRRTGLLGADRPEVLGYAAAAAATCAVVLGCWAVAGRVRAGSIAASALAPAALVLAGAHVARSSGAALPLMVGLVAAAALAGARRSLPGAWHVERTLLQLAAAGALTAAAALAVPSVDVHHGGAVAVLGLAAIVAALQATADRWAGRAAAGARSAERTAHAGQSAVGARFITRGWSLAAGGLAAALSLPAGRWIAAGTGADDEWVLATVPATAATVLVVLAALRTPVAPGRRPAATTAGAAVVTLLAAVPAVAGAAAIAVRAALLSAQPWQVRPSAGVGLAGRGLDDVPTALWAACLAGLVAVAVAGLVAATLAGRPAWLRTALCWLAATAGAVALVTAPLAPRLTVAAAIVLLVTLSVALAVLARTGASRMSAVRTLPALLLATSAVAGALAVAVAWSTRPLSVPVTALGIAGLLLARRAVADTSAQAVLAGLAAGSCTVVVGAVAGLLDRPMPDRLVAAAIAGSVLAGASLVAPGAHRLRAGRAPWAPADRLTAAAVAGMAVVPGLLAALGSGVDGAGPSIVRAQLLLGTLLATAVAVTGWTRPQVVAVADLRVPAAALLTPLAGALSLAVAEDVAPRVGTATVLAGTCAVVALLLVSLTLSGLRTGRRVLGRSPRAAAEVGTAAVGASALGGAVLEADLDRLWVVLLLLGVAAAASATVPDRRRVGWLAGVLLTGSTWSRLVLADVTVVEAYTLPPAAALLVVAALRLRLDPAAVPGRVLAPGAGLALVPSIVAGGSGAPLRPALLLAVAALLVLAALLVPVSDAGTTTGARSMLQRLAPAVAGLGAVTAAGTAGLRIARRLSEAAEDAAGLPPTAVEPWSLGAAAVLVGAAAVLHRRARDVEPLLAAALVSAVAASLLAAVASITNADVGALDGWRAAAAGVLSAAVALTACWRRRYVLLETTGVAAASAAAVVGQATGVGPPTEAWTMPLAALLLAMGALHMARSAVGSWPALGPGVAVLLLPSLLVGLDDAGTTLRAAGLVVLAAGTVAVGAARRLQAPLLLGAGVLAAHATAHLSPYVAALYAQVPLWGTLATAGALLLVLGATYERRVQQLRVARLRLAALR